MMDELPLFATSPAKSANVVYLLNFFAPDTIAICQCWSRMVGDLRVLTSVEMEGNRSWKTDLGGVDVRVQKTWTRTRQDCHPGGYSDVNYVHLPLDTLSQLRRSRAQVVVSVELGFRSILAAIHAAKSGWLGLRRRRCQLVIAVSTTPWIEASRSGWLRNWQRRCLLKLADHVTYHGPECRELLLSLGVPEQRMSLFQYAADPAKIYRGELIDPDRLPSESLSSHGSTLRVLTVGQLIARKGVSEGLAALIRVAQQLPELSLHWSLVGDGPLRETLQATTLPDNLQVDFLGNCDAERIRNAYRDHELLYFPTLGDEWGLVVDEALHSGLVVVGNRYAQAVTTLIQSGRNGWIEETDDPNSLSEIIHRFAQLTRDERLQMRQQARHSVQDRTPERSARQITSVIDRLLGAS